MRKRPRVALTLKSRAPPLPGAIAWGAYHPLNLVAKIVFPWCWWPWMRCFFPRFFPRLLQLRFIAATLGWWYICETQSETLISRPNRDGRWGFPRNLHDRHFPSHLYQLPTPPPHIFPHTLQIFPILYPLLLLIVICNSGPKKCWSANLTLKTFWKKSFHFLQPLNRLCSLPPLLHSKHNFRNIFTRISRQCDVKSSFVESQV